MRAGDLALPGAAGQLLEDLADLEQRRGLRRVAERQAPAAAVDVVELVPERVDELGLSVCRFGLR